MRLVVQFINKNYTNINVDRLEREESFVIAYRGDGEIRAVIDLGAIEYLYLSEERGASE